MTARILDGQSLAARMQEEIKPEVAAFTKQHGRPPGLGIVLAGNDPASQVYVGHKVKAGTSAGFRVDLERLPETASLSEALALVERLNASPDHDGILVQSPLPKGMGRGAEQAVFDTIHPSKDVDGFVLPVPKKSLEAYRAMARKGGRVWKDHGALDFVETVAEDVKPGKVTSFPQAVKAKRGETVVFAWIVFVSLPERFKNVVGGGAPTFDSGYTFKCVFRCAAPGFGSPFFMNARPNRRLPNVGDFTTK